MQTQFSTKLTKQDWEIHGKLWNLLKLEGKWDFSSDDFRCHGLDQYFPEDKRWHLIGSMFMRFQVNRLINPIGIVHSVIPSNHGRKISLYRMKNLKATIESDEEKEDS